VGPIDGSGADRGGPYSPGHMTLPGSCTTKVRYTKGKQATVSFTERWPIGSSRWQQHTWEVAVSSTAKVPGTQSIGTPPPVDWK
jgi:hypothetical protein